MKEDLSFLNLLLYAFLGIAVGGIEGAIVAIDTASTGDPSIPVGTGKACVYGYLLYLEWKSRADPRTVICELFLHISPQIYKKELEKRPVW